MIQPSQFVVGTSGYSFPDWVGSYYPAGTKSGEMFDYYVQRFAAVELNFTFYAMPFPRTLESLARRSPEGFEFWLKANQEITHKGNLSVCGEFIADLSPLCQAGKLAGVILQFPQSFHRTAETRQYLSAALHELRAVPLAVEFRHASWDDPAVAQGLRERNVALVIPDEPAIRGLYRPRPTATGSVAYLRLHSRDQSQWYGGLADRYDYLYSDQELREVLSEWTSLPDPVRKVYTFFNNCHRGQAAINAETFKKMLGQRTRGGTGETPVPRPAGKMPA
jgi:uncharacterized protein YecE (DUF72 family)